MYISELKSIKLFHQSHKYADTNSNKHWNFITDRFGQQLTLEDRKKPTCILHPVGVELVVVAISKCVACKWHIKHTLLTQRSHVDLEGKQGEHHQHKNCQGDYLNQHLKSSQQCIHYGPQPCQNKQIWSYRPLNTDQHLQQIHFLSQLSYCNSVSMWRGLTHPRACQNTVQPIHSSINTKYQRNGPKPKSKVIYSMVHTIEQWEPHSKPQEITAATAK